MTVFWIMTALVTALAGLLVLAGARRGADEGEHVAGMAAAAELAELDRLKARGLLDEAGWTAARAEAGRRILSAERETLPVRAGPRDRFLVLAGIGVTAAATLGVYALYGAPGLPDQAYERRVDEWTNDLDTLEAPQIAAVAARIVRERPDDHEALTMLGAARFEAGDPIGAASAFRRALVLQPDDAQSWARLGESLVRANGGKVGGDAEAAFVQALRRDPGQLGARYFLGEAAMVRGDRATVRAMWAPLLATLDPSDPRRIDLERRLVTMEAGA
ncbi:c-type cytochrome biogenesis protein CcmI [Brevundimonas sp. Root1423]|uniref:c-type cytochrome biogenesis protein CcmI n=1 Tax=Brevundimonas sp. Root1423 TaxID=1736462 RepID=UPI0006F484A4|nr:c-type cytochrome biogenesis protein CcmI [Brevundimonas sp. Root1423]KQY80412.1 cytochrome C biogenesis protein CcmI [Brevundimonas sp. Root1423]